MRRIAFLAGILVTLAVAGLSVRDFAEISRSKNWPSTTGRVFSSRVIAKGQARSRFGPSHTVYTYEETIEYSVDGQTYYTTIRTLRPTRDETSISYNPRQPSEIWMGTKIPDAFEVFLFGAAVIGLIVTAYRWVKYEREE